jgi:hypothetical protein
MTKTCFKCGTDLPLSEFYKHSQTADRYLNKCKQCAKTDRANNYRARRELYVAYEKERNQLPHRIEARKLYQSTHPAVVNPIKAKWIHNNPEKRKAENAVNNAVRDKRLLRGECCEICGSTQKVEAHHDDYSARLDVQWLCKKHHWEADLARQTKESMPF